MCSMLRCFSFILVCALLFPSLCLGQIRRVSIDESEVRIRLLDTGTAVELPVRNATHARLPARVALQLIAPSGNVQANAGRNVSLRPGSNHLVMTLSPEGSHDKESLLWYRLRYSVTPAGDTAEAAVTGIVAVGEATPEIFDLYVAGPAYLNEGARNALRVKAQHPVTGRPVAGVTVQASLDLDSDDDAPLLTQIAVTDRHGFATIEFTLPDKVDTDEIDATVAGKLGDYSAEADGELRFNPQTSSSLSTDKALYQPGQTLHMRLLASGNDKKVLADEPATISVTDPDGALVYRTDVKTSEFGVASADWQIPENLRLGDYEIRAEFGEGRYADSGAYAGVRISRYELPEFSVTATPDRSFYLPEQNAEVEIRADYLFGKPVSKGHVRVVRESERRWNFREQKWDVDEGASYEGDTDAQGRYVAHVDLTEDHDKLAENGYERFRDVSLAAYLTDASTGRTEQRRFDLRVTKDPIHVYVIQPSGLGTKSMPLEFYVSADYADGSPAQCEVTISEVRQPSDGEDSDASPSAGQVLRQVHTNRYGVAKITGVILGRSFDPDGADRPVLRLDARDRRGAIGYHTEDLYFYSDQEIRVTTDKALYGPGEPIQVALTTAEAVKDIVVDVAHESHVLASKVVHMDRGRGTAVFDTDEKFENEVTLRAYALGSEHKSRYDDEVPHGVHTVLFPKNREMKMDIRLAKGVYRPGDEADARVHVYGSDGLPERGALGLVVVDKAVEERERADREFNGSSSGWRGFFGFREAEYGGEQLGGIRRNELDKVDLSKPLPDGWDLAAEILLQSYQPGTETFASDDGNSDLRQVFATEIDAAVQPIQGALRSRYSSKEEYPKSETQLQGELADEGIRFEQLRDPWGGSYRALFRIEREMDVLEISSAGPDKRFGTEDDFVCLKMSWPYFKPHSDAIRRAAGEFHERTGGYIRDAQTLKAELARHGEDFDTWKDPWGHAYELAFGVAATRFVITVKSAGPTGRRRDEGGGSEEITLTNVGVDYTEGLRARMDSALSSYYRSTGSFPSNLDELRRAVEGSGVDWDAEKDAWGRPYYATFRTGARYTDRVSVESYEQHEATGASRLEMSPVTQRINWIYIRSAGRDGIEGTPDDFDVAEFSRAVAEQGGGDAVPLPVKQDAVLQGAAGAISGHVSDSTGGAIAGAEVAATNNVTGQSFEGQADDAGTYLLRNLPAGFYTITASSTGFQSFVITNVPVRSSNVTALNVVLSPGTQTQTVTVTEEAPQVNTTAASLGLAGRNPTAASKSRTAAADVERDQQLSTPRLRDYFPETLYWQPELVTDGNGKAQVRFPLADNITTWKLSAVASTKNGEIGTAEKEIRAFQPFFVESDPPQFLTAGDEITLPIVLRNYLDHKLQVNTETMPADWLAAIGPTKVTTNLAARDTASPLFGFRALAPVKGGKFEVKARATDASDAVSRPVTVRPNGEEKTDSISEVFAQKSEFDVNIPEAAISGSLQVQLKIYPNLLAHLVESIEGILQRPYGCAEQTISSAYPSLLFLQYATQTHQEELSLLPRTRHYVEIGYQRLLSYRAPDGGFSYWGRGGADLAVTAYAVKFLHDASSVVAIDDSLAGQALGWLLSQQQSDGRWLARDGNRPEDVRRSAILTAYIARTIAESGLAQSPQDAELKRRVNAAVNGALSYLKPRAQSMDEPYMISTYALLAFAVGHQPDALTAVERLRKLEHREGDVSYWVLETNTPFYGWGLAGRVETTALVLQALAKARDADRSGLTADEALSRGLLFLLHGQDRYGVWYSTQTTVNVVQTLFSLALAQEATGGREAAAAQRATILVDGKELASVDLPAPSAVTGPVMTDLTGSFTPGSHHIEVRRAAGASLASLQVVSDYYVPWTSAGARSALHHEATASDAVRLDVDFDKKAAHAGESVQCQVAAERIGFRGYGMMVAEVGLPPGAEVDRASLESALKQDGWGIDRLLPPELRRHFGSGQRSMA